MKVRLNENCKEPSSSYWISVFRLRKSQIVKMNIEKLNKNVAAEQFFAWELKIKK